MDRLLRFLLKTFIRRGTFRVTTSRGTVLTFGDGSGHPVSVRFATRAAEWGILLDPELKFGEAYMDGTFVVEQGSIADVLAIMLGQNTDVPHWARLQGFIRYLYRRLSQFNPRPRSRRNVAHHYDLVERLAGVLEIGAAILPVGYGLPKTNRAALCAYSISVAAGAGLASTSPNLAKPM